MEVRSKHSLIFVTLAAATIVRLWGIQHDLPVSYYPDEAHFVKRAVSFGSGDLNPHWFHKPAFYMYMLFAEYGLYYCFGRLFGTWSSVDEFAVLFVENPSSFYLIGRLTTVAFSLACVWMVYRIGEKHFGRRTGVVAAVLLTFVQGHIASSQQVKADIPTAFFGIASMYFLLNYIHDRRVKSVALSCALAAVGTATKYYTILMLAPICVAVFMRPSIERNMSWRRWMLGRFRALLLAHAVFWGIYFISSPFNFLDSRGRESTFRMFEDALARGQQLVFGQPFESAETQERIASAIGKFSITEGFADYAAVLLSSRGMGPGIGLISLMGLCVLISPHPSRIVYSLYPVLFVTGSVVVYGGYPDVRHQTPIYPFLVVAGGALMTRLAHKLDKRQKLVWGGVLVILCFQGVGVIQNAIGLSRRDTRNAAKQWIEESLPSGTKLVIDENGPPLLKNESQLSSLIAKAVHSDSSGQFTAHYATLLEYQRLASRRNVAFELHEIRLPWWRERFEHNGHHTLNSEMDRDMGNPLKIVGVESYDYYLQNGFQYAIVHSDSYGRHFVKDGSAATDRFPAFSRFYKELFHRGFLIKEFSPEVDGLRGPKVRIYRFLESKAGVRTH